MALIEKQYDIHYYEIDFNKELMITSVMNFFQDIFVHTSEISGKGMDYLANINLTWIVYRWEINMYKYPTFNQKITVKMTPTAYRKSYMNIEFEIFNVNGEKIADALSLWILIDTDKNIPCRNTLENAYEIYGLSSKDTNIITMKKINLPERIDNKEVFKVGYGDIDTNGHVNNVKYLYWLLESISEDIIKKYKLCKIEISYKKDVKYNERITSSSETIIEKTLIRCLHKITDEQNGILAIAETVWKKSC